MTAAAALHVTLPTHALTAALVLLVIGVAAAPLGLSASTFVFRGTSWNGAHQQAEQVGIRSRAEEQVAHVQPFADCSPAPATIREWANTCASQRTLTCQYIM